MRGFAVLCNNRISDNGEAAICVLGADGTALTAKNNDLRGNKAGAWDCRDATQPETFKVSGNIVDVGCDAVPKMCPSEPSTPRTPRSPGRDAASADSSGEVAGGRGTRRRVRFVCTGGSQAK